MNYLFKFGYKDRKEWGILHDNLAVCIEGIYNGIFPFIAGLMTYATSNLAWVVFTLPILFPLSIERKIPVPKPKELEYQPKKVKKAKKTEPKEQLKIEDIEPEDVVSEVVEEKKDEIRS